MVLGNAQVRRRSYAHQHATSVLCNRLRSTCSRPLKLDLDISARSPDLDISARSPDLDISARSPNLLDTSFVLSLECVASVSVVACIAAWINMYVRRSACCIVRHIGWFVQFAGASPLSANSPAPLATSVDSDSLCWTTSCLHALMLVMRLCRCIWMTLIVTRRDCVHSSDLILLAATSPVCSAATSRPFVVSLGLSVSHWASVGRSRHLLTPFAGPGYILSRLSCPCELPMCVSH